MHMAGIHQYEHQVWHQEWCQVQCHTKACRFFKISNYGSGPPRCVLSIVLSMALRVAWHKMSNVRRIIKIQICLISATSSTSM